MQPEEVVVLSTGVIGPRLPMESLLAGVDGAADALSAAGGAEAAEAILTTDSGPKTAVVEDDGAGLRSGVDGNEIFEPGFSTAEGAAELAGHGVGLFAVKQELAQAGYDVSVTTGTSGGARFELRPSAPRGTSP